MILVITASAIVLPAEIFNASGQLERRIKRVVLSKGIRRQGICFRHCCKVLTFTDQDTFITLISFKNVFQAMPT